MTKAAKAAAICNRKFSHAYSTLNNEFIWADMDAMRLYLSDFSVGYLMDPKSNSCVNWMTNYYGFGDGSVLKLTIRNTGKMTTGGWVSTWCAKARAYTCGGG